MLSILFTCFYAVSQKGAGGGRGIVGGGGGKGRRWRGREVWGGKVMVVLGAGGGGADAYARVFIIRIIMII